MGIVESLKIAEELFPNESWVQKSDFVYVASSRLYGNKQENEKIEKELAQAQVFSLFGHNSVLVPEIGKGKHYDAICDGIKTEFKTILGGRSKIGRHFDDAISKAENVFFLIKSDMDIWDVYKAIKGHLKDNPRTYGRIYIYIEKVNEMFEEDIKTISDSINNVK